MIQIDWKMDQSLQNRDSVDHRILNFQYFEQQNTPEKLPRLVGDSRRFKQVLINLIKNALKFTNQGSISILTHYQNADQNLIVHVKDTGVGISEEDIPKLFS